MTGTSMNGVAYRGAPHGLNDVMAGHVALMFADTGTAIGDDRPPARCAGSASPRRRACRPLPDIADHRRGGVPGFDAVGWTLMCAPSATPKPVVDRLHAELKAVAAMPDIHALIVRLGAIPADSPSPAELQKFLASEIDRWGGIIERAGVANRNSATLIRYGVRVPMNDEALLREKTATLTRMLNLQGTIGMFGHVSVRVPAPTDASSARAPAPTRPSCARSTCSSTTSTARSSSIPAD